MKERIEKSFAIRFRSIVPHFRHSVTYSDTRKTSVRQVDVAALSTLDFTAARNAAALDWIREVALPG